MYLLWFRAAQKRYDIYGLKLFDMIPPWNNCTMKSTYYFLAEAHGMLLKSNFYLVWFRLEPVAMEDITSAASLN